MKRSIRWTHEKFSPILRTREDEERALGGEYKKPNDMIQWVYDEAKADPEGRDTDHIAENVLHTFSGAIDTSGRVVISCLHYLIHHQDKYLGILREEIDSIWEAADGKIDSATAGKMDKLDSFILEVQRHAAYARGKFLLALLFMRARGTRCSQSRAKSFDPGMRQLPSHNPLAGSRMPYPLSGLFPYSSLED